MKTIVTITVKEINHCMQCDQRSPTLRMEHTGRVVSYCGYKGKRILAEASYKYHGYNSVSEKPDFPNGSYGFFSQAIKAVRMELRHSPIPDWCGFPNTQILY